MGYLPRAYFTPGIGRHRVEADLLAMDRAVSVPLLRGARVLVRLPAPRPSRRARGVSPRTSIRSTSRCATTGSASSSGSSTIRNGRTRPRSWSVLRKIAGRRSTRGSAGRSFSSAWRTRRASPREMLASPRGAPERSRGGPLAGARVHRVSQSRSDPRHLADAADDDERASASARRDLGADGARDERSRVLRGLSSRPAARAAVASPPASPGMPRGAAELRHLRRMADEDARAGGTSAYARRRHGGPGDERALADRRHGAAPGGRVVCARSREQARRPSMGCASRKARAQGRPRPRPLAVPPVGPAGQHHAVAHVGRRGGCGRGRGRRRFRRSLPDHERAQRREPALPEPRRRHVRGHHRARGRGRGKSRKARRWPPSSATSTTTAMPICTW